MRGTKSQVMDFDLEDHRPMRSVPRPGHRPVWRNCARLLYLWDKYPHISAAEMARLLNVQYVGVLKKDVNFFREMRHDK